MPVYVNCEYCAGRRCALEHAQKARTHWRHVGALWWCRKGSACVAAFKLAQHPNGDGPPSHRYIYTLEDVYPEGEVPAPAPASPPPAPVKLTDVDEVLTNAWGPEPSPVKLTNAEVDEALAGWGPEPDFAEFYPVLYMSFTPALVCQ